MKEFHPLADVLSLVQRAEFDRLVADITEQGLLNPITTYQGKVLDGRNRERACRAAGVEPRYVEFEGQGSGSIRAFPERRPSSFRPARARYGGRTNGEPQWGSATQRRWADLHCSVSARGMSNDKLANLSEWYPAGDLEFGTAVATPRS